MVAVFFGAQVEFDEITALHHAIPGNPVHHFVVDADAHVAGNPYTIGGEDRAPCAASTREPSSQSSAVVIPARTSAAIARSAFLTIIPQARSFSNCSGLFIDMQSSAAQAFRPEALSSRPWTHQCIFAGTP